MMQSIFTLCGGVFVACMRYAETFFVAYIRAQMRFFLKFMKIFAFFENIYTKGRKTLDFSVYVCYAGIVKENGGAVANKNT